MILKLLLVDHDVMRKKAERKNEWCLFEMNIKSGIQEIKTPRFLLFIILYILIRRVYGYFLYLTGPSWISGNILNLKISLLFHFIFQKNVESNECLPVCILQQKTRPVN